MFKSYKQAIKVTYRLEHHDEALELLSLLVKFSSRVSRPYVEESLSKIINTYLASPNGAFVDKLYEIILRFLETGGSNDRLWLKININKLNDLLERNDYGAGLALIREIKGKLDEVSEVTRNTFSLEIVAAEIDCYSHQQHRDLGKLAQLYHQSLSVTNAVTHPRIMGIIRECGATVQFFRGNYENARVDFYESFKSYDEAGSSSKRKILKYLSLCSVLTENEVNPFISQETQTYSQLPEYLNLIQLLRAYDDLDLEKYITQLAKMRRDGELDDDIIASACDQVLHNLKAKILLSYLESYSAVRFDFLTTKLGISQTQLEHKILRLANQGRVANIKMDHVNQHIETNVAAPLFSPTLDARVAHHNIQTLEAMGFPPDHDEKMDVDDDTRASFVSRLVYVLADAGEGETDTESWLRCLQSAIPQTTTAELSQKDLVVSKQRQESSAAKEEDVQVGILGAAPVTDDHEDDDDEESAYDEVDALRLWAKELSLHHERLVKVHRL